MDDGQNSPVGISPFHYDHTMTTQGGKTMKAKQLSGRKILIALLTVFTIVGMALAGQNEMIVKAEEGGSGRQIEVDFGSGSWSVGGVEVTVTDRSGKCNLSENDEIQLSNFNAGTMQVKVSGTGENARFQTILRVTDGKTSLKDRESTGGYPDTVTFSVEAKMGEQPGPNPPAQLTNPVNLSVTIKTGSDLLDPQGSDNLGTNLWVDGYAVDKNNHQVTVNQSPTHKIAILPQFGIGIGAKINGTQVLGTEDGARIVYEVKEEKSYSIELQNTGNGAKTVAWDYVGELGNDAHVEHGTINIVSATKDGTNSIGLQAQDKNGGMVGITPGSTVTVELKPEYGYQLAGVHLNGTSLAAAADVSTFIFTMPDTNLHFKGIFTKVEDTVDISAAGNITSASITNGDRAIDSGNLSLTATNDISYNTTTAQQKVSGAVSSQVVDLTLNQMISKGDGSYWNHPLTELNGSVTLSLGINGYDPGYDYVVVREHNGTTEALATQVVDGKVVFDTDKFSTYVIVKKEKTASGGNDDSSEGGSGTSDTTPATAAAQVLDQVPKTGEDMRTWFAEVALLIVGSGSLGMGILLCKRKD